MKKQPPKGFLRRGDTKELHAYQERQTLINISWEVAPHLAAGFSNVILSDIDVEVFPESAEGTKRFFRAVVCRQRIHKSQDFLLLLRRKLTKPVNDLFFNSHKICAYYNKAAINISSFCHPA